MRPDQHKQKRSIAYRKKHSDADAVHHARNASKGFSSSGNTTTGLDTSHGDAEVPLQVPPTDNTQYEQSNHGMSSIDAGDVSGDDIDDILAELDSSVHPTETDFRFKGETTWNLLSVVPRATSHDAGINSTNKSPYKPSTYPDFAAFGIQIAHVALSTLLGVSAQEVYFQESTSKTHHGEPCTGSVGKQALASSREEKSAEPTLFSQSKEGKIQHINALSTGDTRPVSEYCTGGDGNDDDDLEDWLDSVL